MLSNNCQFLTEKYRPKLFREIKGQNHVINLTKKSILNNCTYHTYLITGIRGIGKTSFARVFSKAINCKNISKMLSVEPCLNCYNCSIIEMRKHRDIVEFDAASSNGVEEIKNILKYCRYSPSSLKYKVFIIDEVHMLSISAFNALLNILEFPPYFCKFLLATTEIKKIPITILSRCHKINLFKLNYKVMFSYLIEIFHMENIKVNNDIIDILVNLSDGSIRDVLFLMDQIINISKSENINDNIILSMLGIVNPYITYEIIYNIINSNFNNVLYLVRNLFISGISANSILNNLVDFMYKITMYKIGNLNFNSYFFKNNINILVNNISVISITRLWEIFFNFSRYNCYFNDTIQNLEMFLIKIMYMNFFVQPEDVIELNRW